LNTLAEKYGDKLAILGFPCNQFGHQCYDADFELMKTLEHVRPGDGYVPKFPIMAKSTVNGADEEPLWTYLKSALPAPSDDRAGTGSDFIYDIQPTDKPIQWSPVRRSDISWNFEKFLVNQDGEPVKRYSPKFENANIADDIDALLKDPNASI
jgi:glutathione peroxidase